MSVQSVTGLVLSNMTFGGGEARDTTAREERWRRGKDGIGAGRGWDAQTKPCYNHATTVWLLSRRGQKVVQLASTDRVRRDAREPGRGDAQKETEERSVRLKTP